MKEVIGVISFVVGVVILICFITIRIVWGLQFEFGCTQYLKRAADANTIILAKQNLDKGIEYLEKHDLTNGVVSIFFHQPQNDIGFLYSNLKSSSYELTKVTEGTTQMERSNLLMKLRETLLDTSKSTQVTCPTGISAYPVNALMFWIGTLACLFVIIGLCISWDV